jgi:hypothetical protein
MKIITGQDFHEARRQVRAAYSEGLGYDGIGNGPSFDAQSIIERVIDTLRRDPRFAVISFFELSALLRDLQHEIEDELEGLEPLKVTFDAIAAGFCDAQEAAE